MDNPAFILTSNMLVHVVVSLFMLAILIIVATIVGGWLVFKGKSTAQNEPFLRKDTSPGAYSINADGQDFPEQKPDENEEHILKKTESFLRSIGGGGNAKS